MIEQLPDRVDALPGELRRIFDRLLYLNLTTGRAIPPDTMLEWVERQFGDAGAVREQAVVTVTNRLTLESALFNPVRARRPAPGATGDAELEARIARELGGHDLFRDPERWTTADVFGRIRGRFCITASNVAKYAGWHGLVIFDEPHPLRFGVEQLADYFDTALRWIAAAHAVDAGAIYPVITWNCLPKSGATLMHGHMQIALASGMHFAHAEAFRRAAEAYRAATARGYFDDLFALHAALGLALPAGESLRAFAYLTPARNREVVVLASPQAVPALAATLAALLRRMIDQIGVRAFNLALILPPLVSAAEEWRDVPIVARIGDRGNPLTDRSDVGAMELFVAGCITADPFEVAAALA